MACGLPAREEIELAELDTGVAHVARVYHYWLGGTANFAADREAAEQAMAAYPDMVLSVRSSSSSWAGQRRARSWHSCPMPCSAAATWWCPIRPATSMRSQWPRRLNGSTGSCPSAWYFAAARR